MNRPPDRKSRTAKYRQNAADDQVVEQDVQPLEEAYMPEETAPQPRRRRSQAMRINGEDIPETPQGRQMEDTIIPPSKDDMEMKRRYGRPGDAPVPPRRKSRVSDADDLYDDDDGRGSKNLYDDDDDGEPPRKRHTVRWVVLTLVLLLIVAGTLMISLNKPAGVVENVVQPAVKFVRELFNGPDPTPTPSPEPTIEPTPSPSPAPDVSQAAIINFKATPEEQLDVNQPILFEVLTTSQTDMVEILDDNGQSLFLGGELDYTETDTGRLWLLSVYFLNPYEGLIEAVPGNVSGWNDAGVSSLTVKVGDVSAILNAGQALAGDGTAGGDTTGDDTTGDDTTTGGDGDGTIAPMSAALTDGGFEAVPVTVAGQAYDGSGEQAEFTREAAIDMPDADNYHGKNGMNGVLTFRSSGMRQNAAFGSVAPEENTLELSWSADAGIASTGEGAHGSQPVIVQWHENIREAMTMNESKLSKNELREVIFAGNDGVLYYFDLDDGEATRDPLVTDPALPMLGTPAVYPRGFPMYAVGTGDPDGAETEESAGLTIFNTIRNGKVGNVPGNNNYALNDIDTIVTSPLFDNATDSLLYVADDGILYAIKLNTSLNLEEKSMPIKPAFTFFRLGEEGDDVTVSSSLAAYGEYAYYATNGGVLVCVNINTFTIEWSLQMGAPTDATIALAQTDDGVALYHASRSDVEGLAHMRRIDAETGDIVWDNAVPGTITASPLVGTGALDGQVFFAVRNSEAGGTFYALDAATGEMLWNYTLMGTELSSPLALYSEDGKAWIVQGDEGGLLLLDGLTGDRLDYLALDSAVYGSPAAYEDMIIVATTDGQIHGVKLK